MTRKWKTKTNRRTIDRKVVTITRKNKDNLKAMAESNDKFLRVFKKHSPCVKNGGCISHFNAGECDKDTVRECYKFLSKMSQGSR